MRDPLLGSLDTFLRGQYTDIMQEGPEVHQLQQKSHLFLKEDISYRQSQVSDKIIEQLVLPLLRKTGSSHNVDHLDRDRTLELLRERYFGQVWYSRPYHM